MAITNGAIVWTGRSLVDGNPLVVIVTGLELPSHNRKTGWMLQTFVLRADILPTDAVKSGADVSTCANCPLRRTSCYVNLLGVNQVWRKFTAGGYPLLYADTLARIKRRSQMLRITAYGDAASTPYEAWEPLIKAARGSTGYTHQWRTCDPRWRSHLMASVEKQSDRSLANSLGWRTFRPILKGDSPGCGEILCTNAKDDAVQCESCGLCNGTNGKSASDICDPVHGVSFKINNFQKLLSQ